MKCNKEINFIFLKKKICIKIMNNLSLERNFNIQGYNWSEHVCASWSPVLVPLWNLCSRNRVTPVSIQDGVEHGITFVAISPISAELSPIPAALSRPTAADATTRIIARLATHKTLLNILKHHVKHFDT